MNYLDLLPEEIIQYIWKFIYNDNLKELENLMSYREERFRSLYQNGMCVNITHKLIKRRGYYHNILKEKYNVVLFTRDCWLVPWQLNDRTYDYFVDKWVNNGLTSSKFGYYPIGEFKRNIKHKIHLNCLRNSDKYTKLELFKMLKDNGYEMACKDIDINKKYMYKSWKRDRIIRELMSL
jgi:hypothetical protein